ncbi:MAG: hypothetical protein ACYTF7_08200 [Planctomycetota bacterium]|jgi:hypothetical protein
MSHENTAPDPLEILEKLARKGKLPGYEALSDSSFRVDAFGVPFDADLIGSITSRDPLTVSYSLRVRMKIPAIFAIVTLLTIWPGVAITDSLIPGEWGWWPTAYWYLPLTIIPLPWLVVSLRKRTHQTTRAHAQEQIARICATLNATPTGPAFDAPGQPQDEPVST